MKISPNAACPCGKGLKYKQCCRPFHRGLPAPTPESLMRSRYAAYALQQVAYIIRTTHPDSPHFQPASPQWQAQLEQFCRSTRFDKLDVLSSHQDDDDTGHVTFRATLFQGSQDSSYTERSLFKRHNGKWMYVSAES